MASRDRKTGDAEREIAARVHALLESGLHCYAQGDVEAALADWEHALALDPGSAQARQYIDEASRNLETLDHALADEGQGGAATMDGLFPLASADAVTDADPDALLAETGRPGPAPGTGPGAGADAPEEDPSIMDTLDDGWALPGEAGRAGETGTPAAAEGMVPDDLRAVAEELLGISRQAPTTGGAAADRGHHGAEEHEPPSAGYWDDAWSREPTIIEAKSAALAPTVELVLPARGDALFNGAGDGARYDGDDGAGDDAGDDPGDDHDPMDEDPFTLSPPPGVPPVIIEEHGGMPAADDVVPGNSAPGDDAPGEHAGEPTVAQPRSPDDEHAPATSRTETLEMFGASPGGSPAPRAPAEAPPGPSSSVARRLLEELAEELGEHAPAGEDDDEDEDEALRRRMRWLIERAESECVTGDFETAIIALELALDERPDSAVAQKLIHRHLDRILDIYDRYIDNPAAVPALAITPTQLHEHVIDSRAAFLLSRIDGVLTVEDILDVSGMTLLEAHRYLCDMLRRGILELR